MKTALSPEHFDERSGDVVKMEKMFSFQVHTIRLYYVLTRFSQRLTRSC